jgi:hypothetical protein
VIRDVAKYALSAVGLPWLTGTMWYRQVLRTCQLPESSTAEIDHKAQRLRDLANRNSYGRALIWQELARLERVRGNPLIATIFALRTMRLTGRDLAGHLPWVIETLRDSGFGPEAEAAGVMFGDLDHPGRFSACKDLIERTRQQNRQAPPPDYETFDDRRGATSFRVAVVVSMYNAAPKLKRFLDSLLNQTLVQRGEVEFILIDSASPTAEAGIVRAHPLYDRGVIVYARSNRRETIQMAWNRGLDLARSPYVTMLGVDEGTNDVHCFEALASELDCDPSLDWVQANCRLTEVNEQGDWQRDLFNYDRSGYCQGIEYLETGYLSFVGAMLRKSIHDRFGYYDASFRGAGDTEFKNRVLPFIRTRILPRTLGLFLNYPELRMTDHPRTEIEDLRAWHLHRTPAGIDYAWSPRTLDDACRLAWLALRFRKSYQQKTATDFEYAARLVEWLRHRDVRHEIPTRTDELFLAARSLDEPPDSMTPASMAIRKACRTIRTVEQLHRRSVPATRYDYFNDDRFDHFKTIWTETP